jgi:hypothetical protein
MMRLLHFLIDFILPAALSLWSTQPLTEMSTRNLPGVKDGRRVRLITLPPYVSRLSRNCGSPDVSRPCGPPRSVVGILLHFLALGGYRTKETGISKAFNLCSGGVCFESRFGTQAILTELFHGYLQSLQKDTESVTKAINASFQSFPVYFSSIVVTFDTA